MLLGLALLTAPGVASATGALPPPAKPDKAPVEHGARPDPQAVRPGSPDGDAPSSSVGTVIREPELRILGLPVNAVLLIGGVIVTLLIVAWIVAPPSRRRDRARGGGTYGRP
jgi:hypothetical protein